MKTFQQPLTSEEEARWILLLKEGDPGQQKAARETLTLHNMRLVAHIAKKYQVAEEDPEDILSIGTIGLIKAINSFDIGKGKLATYACRCIENEILMLLRSKKKSSREVSLFEAIGQDKEGNEIQLVDIIEQNQSDILTDLERDENARKLWRLLQDVLTPREREIVMLRYGLLDGEEWTQSQIGEVLHISRSYVSRIEKKALGKLRAKFEEKKEILKSY